MASVIDIKEIPTETARAFARVDSVDYTPIKFYEGCKVDEKDRAKWVLKPADPVTNDGLKAVIQTIASMRSQMTEGYGLTEELLGLTKGEFDAETTKASPKKAKKAFKQAREVVWSNHRNKINQFHNALVAAIHAVKSESDTRELILKCVVSVDNYKVLSTVDGEQALVMGDGTTKQSIMTVPPSVMVDMFNTIQLLSNLSEVEAMGF